MWRCKGGGFRAWVCLGVVLGTGLRGGLFSRALVCGGVFPAAVVCRAMVCGLWYVGCFVVCRGAKV